MGVISHKDVFSSKHITAIVENSSNRGYFIPIKYVIGDFWLAKIEGLIYCFRIEQQRIKIYSERMTKAARYIHYDTSHYMPMSPADVTELENILKENNLPNVDRNLLKTFQILGKREKKVFQEHDITALAEEIGTFSDKYQEEVRNMQNFLRELEAKKIVTPVKKIAEFIQDDLITTDPQFMGSIVSQASLVENEHKKVTNTPLTGKTPWMKMIAILAIIGIVGGLAYYAYSSGAISHISIPGLSNTPTSSDIINKYPDPAILKQQIADGKVKYSDLPPEVQKMVDATKLPANPIPQK